MKKLAASRFTVAENVRHQQLGYVVPKIGWVVLLWLVLMVSAVVVVNVSHAIRVKSNQLSHLQNEYNLLHQQHNKLLLEISTLASPIQVEKIAKQQLGLKNRVYADEIQVDPLDVDSFANTDLMMRSFQVLLDNE